MRRDFAAARALHEEAVATARELGDPHETFWSFAFYAGGALYAGEYALAHAYFDEALTAGRTTVVGATGFPIRCWPPLAMTAREKAAYTITNSANPALAQLAKVNLRTGVAALVGQPLGQDLFIMGMTFSPDGVLYAAGGDVRTSSPTFNSLYTINRHTGAATRVGSLGVNSPSCAPGAVCFSRFIMSLSFDPEGNLYGATTTGLYRIEPETGAATKVVDIVGSSAVMGISFAEDATLYAADYIALPPGSTIYTVNLKTGVLTPQLRTGIALVHNIAFMPDASDCAPQRNGRHHIATKRINQC